MDGELNTDSPRVLASYMAILYKYVQGASLLLSTYNLGAAAAAAAANVSQQTIEDQGEIPD